MADSKSQNQDGNSQIQDGLMMEPVCAQAGPFGIELAPGKYLWCTCGLSTEQPFCDGRHKNGTSFKPILMTIKEQQTVWLCGCKATASAPFCDGTHRRFL